MFLKVLHPGKYEQSIQNLCRSASWLYLILPNSGPGVVHSSCWIKSPQWIYEHLQSRRKWYTHLIFDISSMEHDMNIETELTFRFSSIDENSELFSLYVSVLFLP